MKNLLIARYVLALALALAAPVRAADGGAAGSYTGSAVDGQGRPVPGATVECYVDSSPVSFYTAQGFAVKDSGTTDSKGAFTVPIGGGVTIVVVKKEGLAPGWRTFASVLEESSDPVVLSALATPARSEVDANGQLISYSAPVSYALAGGVVDENGRPVADADVWVSLAMPAPKSSAPPPTAMPGLDSIATILNSVPAGGEFSQSSMIFGQPARDCFSTRTGADGRFRIANFPGNARANLAVHKSGMALIPRSKMINIMARPEITAPPPYMQGSLDTAALQQEIMPCTSGQLNIGLLLEPAGNIEGTVTGQGQPVPGARLLTIYDSAEYQGLSGTRMQAPVLSGPDGSFRMADLPPGMMTIVPVFSGEPVADWMSDHVYVSLAAGKTTEGVSIHGQKGDVEKVTVLQRKDRSPIANVVVSVSCAPRMDVNHDCSLIAVTGPDGVAQVRLVPDLWTFHVSKEGWNETGFTTGVRADTGRMDPVEILMDRRHRLTGIVRDPSGAPVAGAIVSLTPRRENMQVTTDANGRYQESWPIFAGVNQQAFTLTARSVERHLAVNVPMDASMTNLDLNLRPAVTLMAKLEDTTGKPVTNAGATLMWINGDRSGVLAGGASDAQGRIEFADMPPADGYSINVVASGYGSGGGNFMSPPRQANRLQFPAIILPPANQKLAGKVLYKDGRPAAGIVLNSSGPNQPGGRALTDTDGSFSFDGVCEGPLQIMIAQGSLGSAQGRGGDTNLILRVDQNNNKQGLNLTGIVRDATGEPVAGAVVTVSPNTYHNPEVKADATGRYTIAWRLFTFANPPHYLVATSAEHNLAATAAFDDATTNLDLVLGPAVTVSAKVQDARGKQVTNASAFVYLMTSNGSYATAASAHTDSRGLLEFTNMPPMDGHYHSLRVSAEGYANGYGQMRPPGAQSNRLEFPTIILPRADLTLTGTVRDPDGKPAAGVRVKVWGDTGRSIEDKEKTGEVKTDADGRYLIRWTKQDWGGTKWSPFIFARDLEHNLAASKDIDENTTNQDLTLQPGLTLSAAVQDAGGKPIPTATESLTLWSGLAEFRFDTIPYRADDQGIIEITALPQGRHYSASISARGYGSAYPVAQIADTQTNRFSFPTVVLKAADRKLAGQVLAADGAPVPGARVFINVNAQSGMQVAGETTTDAQGRFSFDAVAGGTFQMMVNGGRSGGIGSALVEGGDTNVVFRYRAARQAGATPPPMVTTSGTVFDTSVAPDPGVVLWMMPPGIGTNSKSDASGKFTVSWRSFLPIGKLFTGRDLERNLATAVILEQETTNVDLHLQRAFTLSGSVQDNKGAALKDAKVGLNLSTPAGNGVFIPLQPAVDEQGAFTFAALPPGQSYIVNAVAPGFASTSVKIGAEQTQTASLQLPPIQLQPANRPRQGQAAAPAHNPAPGSPLPP